MAEIERNERLLQLYRQKKRRQEGQSLLEKLPQGHGSGLDADTVDGLHAKEIIDKARIIVPASGSGGGTGMTVHGNAYHTPDFALVRESHVTFIAVSDEITF